MIALSVKLTKRNRIPELKAKLRPRMEKIINDHATQIASIARQLCPVDTGRLRDSIAVETYSGHRPGFGVAKRVVVGAKNEQGVEYGPFVEFGTVNMAAQPFLMPAFLSVQPQLIAAMKQIAKL